MIVRCTNHDLLSRRLQHTAHIHMAGEKGEGPQITRLELYGCTYGFTMQNRKLLLEKAMAVFARNLYVSSSRSLFHPYR